MCCIRQQCFQTALLNISMCLVSVYFIWYNAHCHRALTVKVMRPTALIKEHPSYLRNGQCFISFRLRILQASHWYIWAAVYLFSSWIFFVFFNRLGLVVKWNAMWSCEQTWRNAFLFSWSRTIFDGIVQRNLIRVLVDIICTYFLSCPHEILTFSSQFSNQINMHATSTLIGWWTILMIPQNFLKHVNFFVFGIRW